MYKKSAEILLQNKDALSKKVSKWISDNYPYRTKENEKCDRDVSFIINAVASCLSEKDTRAIDHVIRIFFKGGKFQLKSFDAELEAYNYLLREIEPLLSQGEPGSFKYAKETVELLKESFKRGTAVENGFNFRNEENRQERVKRMFYGWDEEMEIVRQIQKCQRNWDHSQEIHPEVVDYLLWHAENSPSKQWEAYYDVYWTSDRQVLDELYEYTWGTTHNRNPPSTWRNSQMNANLYILFVAKEPETKLNCHADGTLKSNKDPARWENAYVSIGIAMGLVMRAAAKLGLATGCNKSHGDMNGNDFWEKRLGILDDVQAGTKKIAYGIGIGFPQEGRPRWETDQTELCIGSGNGSNLTDRDENHPEWQDNHPRTGKKFRKVKIIDIHSCNEATDPYGNVHKIPDESTIKINSMRKRQINVIEIK